MLPTLPDPLRILPEVLRTLAGPVLLVDPDGTIRHANPALERICGHAPGDLVGQPVLDALVAPEDREDFPELFEQVLAGASTDPVEVGLRAASGETRTMVWSYTVLRRPTGEPEAILATGTDVTDLRILQAREDALRASEARFSGIVEVASDAIISVDRSQRIVLFNEGAESTFGYRAEEVLGRPLELLLPPGARAAHAGHVQSFGASPIRARKMGERREIQGLRKNGEEFPAEASILKVTVDGELHFTVVLRDISERIRQERAQTFLARVGEVLAGSLELDATLRSLGSLALDFLADFCMVDLVEGDPATVRRVDVRHRDPAMAPVVEGFARVELDRSAPHLMSGVWTTGRPALVAQVTPEHLDAIAQGPRHRELLTALDPRSYLVVPLMASGSTVGALLCMRCGPASREPERPFHHLPYDELDAEVAMELGVRAGLAVENARLFRNATNAVEARDEVMGIVSHDLGNPLQAIFIGLEAMERSRSGRAEGRPGQEEYYLTAIRRSAEVMERLIQDLLEVRRMEAGKLQLTRISTDLGEVVDNAMEMLLPLAQVKKIEMENQVPRTGLEGVLLDPDRIQQVLSNLVGNAVKHTPEGGEVRVWCEMDRSEVRVHVTDTGEGIPDDDIERVFDRFWRAGGGRGRGIGLGLAIARGIVRGHGGRIWAVSTHGEGSTFSFSLPRGKAGAEEEGRQ